MKLKIGLLAITLLMALKITAQNVSVEKSIFGIQTGILGIWVHNENKISEDIVLRSEIGFDGGLRISDYYDNLFVMAPVLKIEPRWYYNLEKRNNKGKNTTNNSANFVAIALSYHPDWFTISNKDNISINKQLTIIPKWAIKRTTGNNITYETGIGLGYQYTFIDGGGFDNNESGLAVDLHLRIGYKL